MHSCHSLPGKKDNLRILLKSYSLKKIYTSAYLLFKEIVLQMYIMVYDV